MNIDLHYVRRYSNRGKKAHLISVGDMEYPVPHSNCGIGIYKDWWFGSGSQKEEDKLKTLPLCRKCKKLVPA